MTKQGERVYQLEATIIRLEREAHDRRKPPTDLPVSGCGSSGCEVDTPSGMSVSGGCRCNELTLRRALRWQKRHADFLTVTIEDMRKDALVIEHAQREADAQRYTWDREEKAG